MHGRRGSLVFSCGCKYRHGHRADAGDRTTSALDELWWVQYGHNFYATRVGEQRLAAALHELEELRRRCYRAPSGIQRPEAAGIARRSRDIVEPALSSEGSRRLDES